MVPISNNVVEVFDLYVPPEKRRCGLGRMLMKSILDVARQQGYEYIQLHVASGNHGARRIYEELGFVITDEELHMERPL